MWCRGRRWLLLCALLVSCARPGEQDPGGAAGGEDGPGGLTASLFRTLPPSESGIDFVSPIDESHPRRALYASGYACGGVAVGDFDGDGRPDLFFTGGPVPNALYLQDRGGGPLRFSRQVGCGAESPETWAAGAAVVDIEGDGDLDIYVANYDAPNQLFVNRGAGPDGGVRFADAAAAFGLDFSGASYMPAFNDYDLDGDLDLFLLTNRFTLEAGWPDRVPGRLSGGEIVVEEEWERYFEGRRMADGKHKLDEAGMPDLLFRNEGPDASGQVRFADVTRQAGIAGRTFGLSSVWFDYNHDGLPDIYVASDYAVPDQLWRNNGDGTFTDVHTEVMPYCSWSSMGSALADMDGNGLVDLMVADMGGSTHFKAKLNAGILTDERRHFFTEVWPRQTMRNVLLLDSGQGKFCEAAEMAGLANTDWTWNLKSGDFDNDGRVDLFVTNGLARNFGHSDVPFSRADRVGVSDWDHYRHLPPERDTNRAFRNLGDLEFDEVGKVWGLDHLGMTFGAATADLDLDGDLDLVTCSLDEPVQVLVNQGEDNHGLLLQLHGDAGNRRGIGAKVTVESGSTGRQVRLVQPATGLLAFDCTRIHFGLGADAAADRVIVDWPDGTRQVAGPLPAGTLHRIEKAGAAREPAPPEPDEPLFAASRRGPQFNHRENGLDDYDDFAIQPLLPWRMSRLGPALAWGDADGDGDDDLFTGGARYQAGALHLNRGDGTFEVVDGPWQDDAGVEDMGVLWVDADRDRDLDLIVASGTAESFEGGSAQRDRLYINRGNAVFVRAGEGALPPLKVSSGPVAAADFDRDGDLDVFIGGRCTPGRYPLVPRSRLLRNDGTPGAPAFVDVTAATCPGLARPGMVTGATWADLDNDGWPDLALSIDYGPIKVFRNEAGEMRDVSGGAGTSVRSGWWHSVTAADVNGDGLIDLVCGNIGLNTKYGKLDSGKTVSIYYGEMDDSGVPRIVESKRKKSKYELPVRGKG